MSTTLENPRSEGRAPIEMVLLPASLATSLARRLPVGAIDELQKMFLGLFVIPLLGLVVLSGTRPGLNLPLLAVRWRLKWFYL